MFFDAVMFFLCEVKPEKLAETIAGLKSLREVQKQFGVSWLFEPNLAPALLITKGFPLPGWWF